MQDHEDPTVLYLKRREDRRLAAGHLWVYSNEIDTARSPLTHLQAGQIVDIVNHSGRWLGRGFANPRSLICARIVSRDQRHPFDRSLITHRVKVALGLRERLIAHPYYRLIFGESDGLPGLVVDRYGDICVVQINTAGMEQHRDNIVSVLDKVLQPAGILLRCDHELRKLEGLDQYVDTIGKVPDSVRLIEHGHLFETPLTGGQKTGWFFDQRDNRGRLLPLVRGRSVLDVFSYVGAWGIQAALAGASGVECVDSSARAVQFLLTNARANNITGNIKITTGDAFDVLKQLRAEQRHFDVVILDPPAFIKRKKDLRSGTQAYRRLNQSALQVLSRDGLLVTCSCSYHLDRDDFLDILRQAALHIDRFLQLLYEGGQAMDHPVLPAMPETRYLKCFVFRVLPRL